MLGSDPQIHLAQCRCSEEMLSNCPFVINCARAEEAGSSEPSKTRKWKQTARRVNRDGRSMPQKSVL